MGSEILEDVEKSEILGMSSDSVLRMRGCGRVWRLLAGDRCGYMSEMGGCASRARIEC
jgi:hypothetical protein